MSASEAPDLPRIADTLSRHRVEYLFVGGIAARPHGGRRVMCDAACVPARAGTTSLQPVTAIRALPPSEEVAVDARRELAQRK